MCCQWIYLMLQLALPKCCCYPRVAVAAAVAMVTITIHCSRYQSRRYYFEVWCVWIHNAACDIQSVYSPSSTGFDFVPFRWPCDDSDTLPRNTVLIANWRKPVRDQVRLAHDDMDNWNPICVCVWITTKEDFQMNEWCPHVFRFFPLIHLLTFCSSAFLLCDDMCWATTWQRYSIEYIIYLYWVVVLLIGIFFFSNSKN